ncbi:MAG: energy-coupling factor ABC transporter ATP-binding protein [Burkholderiaceae bacterium]
MLELQGITLWRADSPVFQGLSLRLTGHRVGLIGANGAGKSSLLRLLQGLLTPESGAIFFTPKGQTPAPAPEDHNPRAPRCGLVFQNPDHQILFPTVMEELCFGQLQRGTDKQTAEHNVRRLAHDYGSTDLLALATHALSEGQKQRLCILSVLADGPELLLLDEPFASLDRKATAQMLAMVSAIAQPIIMASHMLELFEDFDELVWMDRGSIRLQGSPADVIAAYREDKD